MHTPIYLPFIQYYVASFLISNFVYILLKLYRYKKFIIVNSCLKAQSVGLEDSITGFTGLNRKRALRRLFTLL